LHWGKGGSNRRWDVDRGGVSGWVVLPPPRVRGGNTDSGSVISPRGGNGVGGDEVASGGGKVGGRWRVGVREEILVAVAVSSPVIAVIKIKTIHAARTRSKQIY